MNHKTLLITVQIIKWW